MCLAIFKPQYGGGIARAYLIGERAVGILYLLADAADFKTNFDADFVIQIDSGLDIQFQPYIQIGDGLRDDSG